MRVRLLLTDAMRTAPGAPAVTSTAVTSTAATSTAATTADPTSSASAGDAPARGERFETQNPTAAFVIPDGWSVNDESMVMQNSGGDDQWFNSVRIVDPAGVMRLTCSDSTLSRGGTVTSASVVVEQRDIVQSLPQLDLRATASYTSEGDVAYPWVGVTSPQPLTLPGAEGTYEEPFFESGNGWDAVFFAHLDVLDACREVTDAASAEACLASPEVAEDLTVLASFEVHDVPWNAMP